MNKLLFLLILLVIILIINSRLLKYAANTIIGKLVLLVLLISATIHNTIYGLLIAIIFVTLTFDKPLYEGYLQSNPNPFSTSGTYSTRLISNHGTQWPQLGPGDYIESPNKLYRFGIKKEDPYGAVLMDVSGVIYWLQSFPNNEITGIGIGGTTATNVPLATPAGYENYKGSLVFTDKDDEVLLWTPCETHVVNPSQTACKGDPHGGGGNFLFLNDDGSLVFSQDPNQNTIIWSFGPDQPTPWLFTKDNVNPAVAQQFWKQQTIGLGDKATSVWQRMNKFGGCGDWRVPGCQDTIGIQNDKYRLDLKKLYDSGNGLWGPPKAPFDAKAAWDKLEDQMKYKIPFQEQHCQPSSDGKTLDFVNNGKILKNNEIKGKFFTSLDNKIRFSVKFTDDECNPCDPTCNYTLTHSDERILGEEKLRGENSSSILSTITQDNNEVTPNSTNSSSSYVARNKVK